MHISHFANTIKTVWVTLAAVLVLATVGIVGRAMADDGTANNSQHLITIYDGGTEQTIITRAETVGDALEQAGITVGQTDQVEPAVTEQLVAEHYNINVYRARPVIVEDGSTRIRTVTAAQSPAKIAESVDITLYQEDDTELKRVDDVVSEGGAGLKLSIDRATPVNFVLYGKKLPETRTQAMTVGDMLKEKNVKLGPDDGTSIPLKTGIVAGMTIEVWRNGVQTVTQEEAVPMPIEQVKDQDREIGFKEVRTVGKPGKKQVTYEIEVKNGKEVGRKVIQQVETLAPVKQVEVVGAKMTNTFSGSFAEALARLRSCESGGRYDRNSGNGYYGAYQYDISTWANWGGFARADLAPPSVQDEKVWETYKRRGWQPWPSCKVKMGLQDIYR
ncbi:MAG TPA: ubiquitin-like domain-containing protein [Candidatus Saccharibacteria bacterium]|nr:ubiquitin-like domain-containing protein [Candidatus Saccharibacteria bacterium]